MLTDAEAARLYRGLVPAMQAQDHQHVVAIISDLVGGEAHLADRWGALASILAHRGEIGMMRKALALRLSQCRDAPSAVFEAAVLLADTGDPDAAARLIQKLAPSAIDPAQRSHFLATAAAQVGRTEEAKQLYDHALSAVPTSGPSWHGLAVIHRFTVDDPSLKRLRAAARACLMRTEADAMLLYALGKAEDDVGNVDACFSAISSAAAIMRAIRPYDRLSDRRAVENLIVRPQRVLPSSPGSNESPIIVVGAPRSGTTLVEHILASHSGVAGGGEANVFGIVRPDGSPPVDTIQDRDRASAAAHYRRLLAERFGATGKLIDKSLGNTRLIGEIKALIPDAPIVWLRRDPLDVAWSCYRTYFAKGLPWTHDVKDIANYLALDDRLFDHWRAILGDCILVMEYEDLVTNPSDQIARLLQHCDLAFEPSALAAHETTRAVTTASAAQVRKPITRKAIGAAEPYRRHLQPFIDAYRAAGGTID